MRTRIFKFFTFLVLIGICSTGIALGQTKSFLFASPKFTQAYLDKMPAIELSGKLGKVTISKFVWDKYGEVNRDSALVAASFVFKPWRFFDSYVGTARIRTGIQFIQGNNPPSIEVHLIRPVLENLSIEESGRVFELFIKSLITGWLWFNYFIADRPFVKLDMTKPVNQLSYRLVQRVRFEKNWIILYLGQDDRQWSEYVYSEEYPSPSKSPIKGIWALSNGTNPLSIGRDPLPSLPVPDSDD